jgi:hypothetical protein
MLKKPENVSSSFDRLILRQAQDEGEPFQSLKPHGELVEPWATSFFSILLIWPRVRHPGKAEPSPGSLQVEGLPSRGPGLRFAWPGQPLVGDLTGGKGPGSLANGLYVLRKAVSTRSLGSAGASVWGHFIEPSSYERTPCREESLKIL